MKSAIAFIFVLLFACRAASAATDGAVTMELPISTAMLAGNTTSFQSPAGKPADRIVSFCDTLRQLLTPPPAEKGKLPPRKPAYASPAAKERDRQAAEKEGTALKLCDAASAQRQAAERNEEAAAKASAGSGTAAAKVAQNLRNMAGALEQTAIVLYLDAYELRALNKAVSR
ncbi:MAG TPA: hypothetical protein DCZ92_08670 [Elusimicrobia bacterium]|nr:MAG: hypothetical protein A2016_01850 [Elusimicrobia bacterium GWF2_62_30]HBA60878.1 hypothetical protein [Elusimicrobiota bacterium]